MCYYFNVTIQKQTKQSKALNMSYMHEWRNNKHLKGDKQEGVNLCHSAAQTKILVISNQVLFFFVEKEGFVVNILEYIQIYKQVRM